MVQAQINYEVVFHKWQQRRISKAEVVEELRLHELSPEEITAVWEEYFRYRVARRNTRGWLLMGAGGILGLVSCVLTMLDPLPDFRGLFMYGFTGIAVIGAFYGCYLVMENPDDLEA